jgi:hypothetical protein
MPKKSTFTNEQLCAEWAKQAEASPKGTRRDVVLGLMKTCGVEVTEESFRKWYNNVTQRRSQLTKHETHPLAFPLLKPGPKGAKRSETEMVALQAMFGKAEEETAVV